MSFITEITTDGEIELYFSSYLHPELDIEFFNTFQNELLRWATDINCTIDPVGLHLATMEWSEVFESIHNEDLDLRR